jgi:hypothetical protein
MTTEWPNDASTRDGCGHSRIELDFPQYISKLAI